MQWLINPVRYHYVDFRGRATRKEYWLFELWRLALIILFAIISVEIPALENVMIVLLLATLAFLALPGLALAVRRLHDTGHSGWWVLLNVIPYIGSFVFLIFMIIGSEKGTNTYGPNPYGIEIDHNPSDVLKNQK